MDEKRSLSRAVTRDTETLCVFHGTHPRDSLLHGIPMRLRFPPFCAVFSKEFSVTSIRVESCFARSRRANVLLLLTINN
jgi:hypothetical protein